VQPGEGRTVCECAQRVMMTGKKKKNEVYHDKSERKKEECADAAQPLSEKNRGRGKGMIVPNSPIRKRTRVENRGKPHNPFLVREREERNIRLCRGGQEATPQRKPASSLPTKEGNQEGRNDAS